MYTLEPTEKPTTPDQLTDSIVSLLAEASDDRIYLVYCEACPSFTVELTDDSIVAKIKNRKVKYYNHYDKIALILDAPIFDYK